MCNQNRQSHKKQNRSYPQRKIGIRQRPDAECKTKGDQHQAAHYMIWATKSLNKRRGHRQTFLNSRHSLFMYHLAARSPAALHHQNNDDDQNESANQSDKGNNRHDENIVWSWKHLNLSLLVCRDGTNKHAALILSDSRLAQSVACSRRVQHLA
jgi:hypothetical protein